MYQRVLCVYITFVGEKFTYLYFRYAIDYGDLNCVFQTNFWLLDVQIYYSLGICFGRILLTQLKRPVIFTIILYEWRRRSSESLAGKRKPATTIIIIIRYERDDVLRN